jgi:hypothetical protein
MINKKSKIVPVLTSLRTTPWRCLGQWKHSFTILHFGSRWRWVVSFTPQPLYSGWRATDTHRIGGWVGPRACLDAAEERKNSCPYRESNPGPSARSPWLCRLCYKYNVKNVTFWGWYKVCWFFIWCFSKGKSNFRCSRHWLRLIGQ